MPRLMIVEDDPAIVRAVEKTLTLAAGYSLEWVRDPDAAIARAIALKPDLILLDVRLPEGDGRVVLKSLRQNVATSAVPVILLTGLAGEADKVLGLNLGADDYIVKPFGAMELMARIQAVLRRSSPSGAGASAVKAGELSLDAERRVARLGARKLDLQPREFELLFLLAANAGRALSREFLIENTSSYGRFVPTRSLDTHVKNIRRKLGAKARMLSTVPKHGYRLDP